MRTALAVVMFCIFATGCASRKDGSPYDTPFTHTNSNNQGLAHVVTVGRHGAEWIHPGESMTWELDRSRKHALVWKIMQPIGGDDYQQLKVNRFDIEWSTDEAEWYYLPWDY